MKTIILRFRDLVTEAGGTITEHRRLLHGTGSVWWGWWARQTEKTPRGLFQELASTIRAESDVVAFLFNSGTNQFYSVRVSRILAAPEDQRITTPDPSKSPEYYHRAPCPAWFLLTSLEEIKFSDFTFYYDSFPTISNQDQTRIGNVIDRLIPSFGQEPLSALIDKPLSALTDQQIVSLDDLRNLGGVTLWAVRTEPEDGSA